MEETEPWDVRVYPGIDVDGLFEASRILSWDSDHVKGCGFQTQGMSPVKEPDDLLVRDSPLEDFKPYPFIPGFNSR